MIKLPPRPKLPKELKNVLVEASKAFEIKHEANVQQVKASPGPCFYQDTSRENIYATLDKWFKVKSLQALLLVGPTGSGKTALIEYFAHKYCVKLDINDEPDEDSFSSTFFKGPLVLDSLETLDPSIRALLKKNLNKLRPLIITAEDRFAECVKAIQKFCTTVFVERPSKQFIKNVLLRKQCPDFLAEEISISANGNLGVAVHANFWTRTTTSTKGASKMFTESPLDVQKATRCLLLGQRLSCIGDVAFLMLQVQNNTLPVSALAQSDIKKLAKAFDGFSLLDLMETKKWFTTEELWSAMECVIDVGPKLLTNQQKFSYEWPKSLKRKENVDYKYA